MSKKRDPAIRRQNEKIINDFALENDIEKKILNDGYQIRLTSPVATIDIFPTSGAYNILATHYHEFGIGIVERDGERGHGNIKTILHQLFFAGGEL